jgi:arylsulfatase A-like enzyme
MRTVLRVLVLAGLALSCGSEGPRLSVLLIGVDTLRPDHLGCYGYDRATSPNIDRLAADGVLFEMPVSQCPWTLPSFGSVLTSLYPTQHGAGINMSTMGTDFPTMGGILAREGYATGAVLSSRVLSPEFGLNRGFDHYDVNEAGEDRNALEVTRLALEWLDGLRGRPFFLFVHYFDPHLPYAPPAPYDTLFDGGGAASIGTSFDIQPLLEAEMTLRQRLGAFTGGDWSRIVSLYDGEIAYTDAAIGELLSGLRDRGLARNTLIVLLADHGEEFFEHGGLGHGHTLFNEVIRVPLVLSLAGVLPRGQRVTGQVRMVDVLPTMLELLGIAGDYRLEGVSLLGMLDGSGRAPAREGSLFPAHTAYSEGLRRGSERKSISAYPWKIIYDTDGDSSLVFNLVDDPRELAPLTGAPTEAVSLLSDLLVRNLIRMADTWYVEMVPGQTACEFSLHISVEQDLSRGNITFCRYLTADGAVKEPYGARIEASRLAVGRLVLSEPLTLAFQVHAPPGLPITFDLSIDGEPATKRTYLGDELRQPEGMPFELAARRKEIKADGPPTAGGPPPYFVVWRSEAGPAGRRAAKLGTDTRKELRALGYIQ